MFPKPEKQVVREARQNTDAEDQIVKIRRTNMGSTYSVVLLSKGKYAKVDHDDTWMVSEYKWHLSDTGYAVWRGIKNGAKKTIRMHSLVIDAPKDKIVDHINHNPLDNRKTNLRICTQSDNMRNMRDQGRGYWFQKQNQNWVVEIYGKHIGCFKTEEEAKEIAAFVRNGGTYQKPERTMCKKGHSLKDAYDYGLGKRCKTCQSTRSKEYYRRKYGRD